MANTDYIKEFLVKLGYQVDPQSQKKFEESLEKSNKSAEGLAKGLKSVAVALGTASTVAAYRLNALYINANRIGTSASKLDALGKAISNVGGDANAAAQSVASLAQKLRDKPGVEGVFERFGINIRDTNGQIRDTIDLMMELVNSSKFRSMEYYQQSAYMREAFGIDDLTFRSIRSGEFAREYQKILEINRKLGDSMDKSAESVGEFVKAFNDIKNQGGAVLDMLVGNLADMLIPALKEVNAGLGKMIDWYSKLSPETKELTKDIGSLAVAAGMLAASLKAISIFKGIGDIFKPGKVPSPNPGTAGNAASKASGIAVSLLKNPASWLAALGIGSFAADAYMTSKDADSVMNRETQGDLVGLIHGKKKTKSDPSVSAPSIIPAAQAGELPKNGNPDRLTAKDVISFFVNKGLTKEQAAGIAGNIAAESNFDHRAVGDGGKAYGYGQWREDKAAGARQKLFKKWFGKDIRESTPYEQLEFMWRELQTTERRALKMLKKAKTAQESGEVVSRHYERPKDEYGENARRRGWMAEQFNQSVNITVNGAKYPEQSAQAVRDVMENRNGVMFRNARTPSR